MTGRRWARVGVVAKATALACAISLTTIGPAAACVGGIEFGWAVQHARGWIVTATVAKSGYVPTGFYGLELRDVEPVRGSPPSLRFVTVAMGLACDQSPEVEDRILLLEDINIEPPFDTPLAYVIEGPGAVPAEGVARVFATLPATDAAPPGSAPRDRRTWLGVLVPVAIGLAASWVAMRRFGGAGVGSAPS